MAKTQKLPSGVWRALVYDYTDLDGKRHYESFTEDTKKEAELMAAEFVYSKRTKGGIQKCSLKKLWTNTVN